MARTHGFRADPRGARTGLYDYADIDDDFISVHHWFKWHKFGFTRLFDNLSLEIRNGRIGRADAIAIIRARGDDTPHDDIARLCGFLDITEDRLHSIAETFRNKAVWHRQGGVWTIPDFLIPTGLELIDALRSKNPPRRFSVGADGTIEINDCGSLDLEPDEQVTFVTKTGAEYDLARKDWGFYATPSLNGRLAGFGLAGGADPEPRNGAVFSASGGAWPEDAFYTYLEAENLRIVHWLDSDEACQALDQAVAGAP
ncbi:hypothetical protein [Azospirillum brasilense]|uniref:hypothetical protein n=1 Tax=Azospirillum brasilense TaxID=192 RepID=UPI001FFF327D|nr:hypothetical protein [Azospirillum brasilense]